MCVSAFRHLLSIHSLALTSFPHFCTSLSLPPSNLAPEEKTCKSPPLEFRPNTLRDWRRKIETHKSRGMWVSPNKDRPTFPIYRVVALQTTIGDCNARPFSPASGSRCIGAAGASRLSSQLQSRTRLLKRTECYEIGERNTRWRGRIVFYWLTDILSTFIVATSNEISRRVPFLCHPTRLFLRFWDSRVSLFPQLSRRQPFCIRLPDNVNGQVTAEPVPTDRIARVKKTPARWWSLVENLRSCYVILKMIGPETVLNCRYFQLWMIISIQNGLLWTTNAHPRRRLVGHFSRRRPLATCRYLTVRRIT